APAPRGAGPRVQAPHQTLRSAVDRIPALAEPRCGGLDPADRTGRLRLWRTLGSIHSRPGAATSARGKAHTGQAWPIEIGCPGCSLRSGGTRLDLATPGKATATVCNPSSSGRPSIPSRKARLLLSAARPAAPPAADRTCRPCSSRLTAPRPRLLPVRADPGPSTSRMAGLFILALRQLDCRA